MKRTALIAIAIAGLTLVGCGSDGGSSDAGGAQGEAADMAIESAAEGGVTLEEECVNDIASKLSDEDAEAIAAGNDADVSAEGSALSLELIGCADKEAIVDLFIQGMSASGQAFDEECAREELANFDIAEVVEASQGAEPPADIISAMMKCVDTGG